MDFTRGTFAVVPKIRTGDRIRIKLAEEIKGPFVLETGHENRIFDIPMQLVLQKAGGSYFGGNLNDPSYIPFKKEYRARNVIKGVNEKKFLPFITGLLLFIGLASLGIRKKWYHTLA